jgi:hypothetical protein
MAKIIPDEGAGYVTPAVLQKEVDRLSVVKVNKDGSYTIDGKRLTPAQRNSLISDAKSKVSNAKKVEASTPELQIAKTSPNVLRDLKIDLSKINKARAVLEKKKGSTKNVEDFDLLNSWIRYYDKIELDVSNAIKSAESGSFVNAIEVKYAAAGAGDSWKSSQPPSTPVDTAVTAPVAAPGTAPVGAMFSTTTTVAAPQTGPQLSESDFANLKPGQNVGGADRKLANGGAVINGIYLPPGLNFGGTQTKPSATTSPTGGAAGGGTGGAGGAGGGGTGGTTGGMTGGTTESTVPADWEQAAQEQYGGYYAIIKSIPEVATLLKNAVANDYSETKFQYELSQTTWFKTTSTSARSWDLSEQTDPASAQQKVDNQATQIKAKALSLGIRLDDTSVAKLAKDSLRGGWDETTITNSIGSQAMQSTTGVSQLRSGFIGQTLRQTAADYGVSLSDDTFNQFVNKVATGQETQSSFQQYALQMAKSLFPGIAAQLDAGQTYKQIVDPYKQTAAQILEMNPENIDFVDPKWSKAVTFVTDKGEQRPMNYNEWGDYLRQTRSFGYEFTSEAQSRAYGVANDLARLFGKA